jgi:microcystin-dependent protein
MIGSAEIMSTQASTADIDAPTGTIFQSGKSTAPSGWLICDGSAVSRTTYATLYGVIGTTYGIGDNSTTFNLPDCRGRGLIGAGTGTGGGASGSGAPTGGAALTARSRGGWLGEETHTLTIPEMPSHTHTFSPTEILGFTSGAGGYGGTAINTIAPYLYNTGGDGAHNNIQPVIVTNFIIKT